MSDDQRRGGTTLRVAASLLVAALSVVVGTLTVVGGTKEGPSLDRWATRIVAASLLVALLFVLWHLVLMLVPDRAERSPGRPIPDRFRDDTPEFADQIFQAMVNVSSRYGGATSDLFRTFLADKYRLVRATEHAEAEGEALGLNVTLDYVIGDNELERLQDENESAALVPLMTLNKGVLLDNFDVTDAGGNTLPTLSQHETMGLLAYATRTLFRLAYISPSGEDPTPRMNDDQETAAWRLLRLVCQRGIRPLDEVRNEFDTAIRGLTPLDDSLVVDLREFCEFFAANYVIAAEVPLGLGNHLLVKYHKSIPLSGRLSDGESRRRVRAGLTTYRFKVPLTLPFLTSSYHFRMVSPKGQFVASHYLEEIKTPTPITQMDLKRYVPHPYVRVRHRAALPYAHLYVRGLQQAEEPPEMSTVVEFEETPPGSLGATRTVSMVASVLVTSFAFLLPQVGQTNSDLAAILLAAPALAASWVGQSADRMERSSLSAYYGLAITGAVSVLSALLYIAQSKVTWATRITNLRVGDWVSPSFDLAWLVLAGASVATTFYLSALLSEKKRVYLELLN